ncbi:MAG TPA: hypothetical protein VFV98_07750 [Vicinamibacterales bacterium]|nr:hypothetical protein [Vicinamibacterales bacterium]
MRLASMMVLACATALSPTLLAQTGSAGRSAAPQTTKPAAPAPATAAAAAQKSVNVTVKYTGKGVVDATHDIVVVLLPGPTVGPDSKPLQMQSVSKNGGVATFQNVGAATVYVLAVYDDKGTWDQQSGPPPAGTPMGWYLAAKATAPTAVTPGPKGVAALTFDGSKKFGQ